MFQISVQRVTAAENNNNNNNNKNNMSHQAANGVPCRGKVLTVDNMNPRVKKVEYAVRGPVVQRAVQIEKELREVRVKCLSCEVQSSADVALIRECGGVMKAVFKSASWCHVLMRRNTFRDNCFLVIMVKMDRVNPKVY